MRPTNDVRPTNPVTKAIKINHANKTVSNDAEIREGTRVWKTDNPGSRAEKMSESNVGDSNHEHAKKRRD